MCEQPTVRPLEECPMTPIISLPIVSLVSPTSPAMWSCHMSIIRITLSLAQFSIKKLASSLVYRITNNYAKLAGVSGDMGRLPVYDLIMRVFM